MCNDGEDCCKQTAKYILTVINFFLLLLGLLMLSFGIAMAAAPEKVADTMMKASNGDNYMKFIGDVNSVFKAAGIFMIILGSILTVISFLGFFGACCENKFLLVLYLILIIIILLAQIALIIFAACFSDKFIEDAKKASNDTMIRNFTQDVQLYPNVTVGSDYALGYSWAALQFGVKCCGTYGPSDYQDENRYPMDKRQIRSPILVGINQPVNYPISCCTLKSGVKFPQISGVNDFENLAGCLTVFPAPAVPGSYNDQSCYSAVYSVVKHASKIAIGIAVAIIVLQVIIISLGFTLCCALHSNKMV